MSTAELLAAEEARDDELEALIAAIEAAGAHEDDGPAPREPAPIEPGPARPPVCIWPCCDEMTKEWSRCERRARWLFGYVINRKTSRESYCSLHALLSLRVERKAPAKVFDLERPAAEGGTGRA